MYRMTENSIIKLKTDTAPPCTVGDVDIGVGGVVIDGVVYGAEADTGVDTVAAERILELAQELERRKETRKLQYYVPYDYQVEWHGAEGAQKLLMAANRIGKSFCGAMEMAIHLTGEYPEWWTGRKFTRGINAWAGGASTETVRDILQKTLMDGVVPASSVIETIRKPGVPGAYSSIVVKHKRGGKSRLGFKAYELGKEKWMGESLDLIWLDEEPPLDIYSQAITRTADKGGLVYMTFTPESGMTETVAQFMNDLRPGQYLQRAGWDDAPHMTPEVKEQILAALPAHERKMRSQGIPTLGSGLVYPVPSEVLECEPFEIPEHWARIAGMDYGWDHPTTCTWLTWDRDSDVVYVYDEYSQRQETAAVHAAAINARPKWIPVVWPRDGRQADKGSGEPLADQYRKLGVNMVRGSGSWGGWFTNPPPQGGREGTGGVSVEAGVMEILERMKTGRFKVFSHCKGVLEELRMYHRKDGRIVPRFDDLLSAVRYATLSLRFARVRSNDMPRQYVADSDFRVF